MPPLSSPSIAPPCCPPALRCTVGVNGGSAPPAVPKNTPFIWRDEPSGKQLLAMWHPGGYSGDPVDSRDECVQVRLSALCYLLVWRLQGLPGRARPGAGSVAGWMVCAALRWLC